MRVAVSGSSGLIGTALVSELQRRGHQSVPIVRRAARGDEIAWNIEAGTVEVQKLAAVDALIHLAGENIGKRWTVAQKARIYNSRVQGTTVLSRALADLPRPPSTFISGSAVGYYGERGDMVCDEHAAPGHDFLADVCLAWEAATEPARQAGLRVVHPRTGMVLSQAGGALTKMLLPFRLGVGGKIGNGRQYWSWITLADLVNALLFALENASLQGPLNATAPNPVTNFEFTKTLGSVLRRPTLFPMPAPAARLVLGQMAEGLLLTSTRAVPAKLQEAGFQFLHPDLKSALESVLA